ncbi:calcium-binding protein [Campylobacter ureolyticus]|uniref:Hemolysin type calcium binding protein RTX n=2 Tax=Campylobacter ureolyticus TaxID=827 RepID=S5TT41_9BACT|nr:calcium-binding protein [Campylobacter ureolyticus]AGS56933.1 hemolysin type calcium binding protein RTX [Campylobacter ureolyticus DSM 20703]
MTEFNKEQETQKFKTAITDFFGITEGGEIKAGGITATAKHVMNAIFEFVQASAKDMDITGFEISSAGIGITFDLAKGYIETTLDGRDRSGASPELYARPDIHFFKLLAKGLVTGTADFFIDKKVKLAGEKLPKIVRTQFSFLKNLSISQITSKTFDTFFGSQYVTIDFTKDRKSSEVLERKYIIQDNLKQSLKHYWSDIKSDINSLERVIIKTDDSGGNIIYYEDMEKDGNLDNTYEFPTNNKTHLLEFLKRFDVGYERDEKNPVHIKLSSKKQLITNYYANYGAGASQIMGDLTNEKLKHSAQHCLKELVGYTLLGNELNLIEYEDLDIYSNKHLDARVNFFSNLITKETKYGEDKTHTYYLDTKTNKHTGRLNSGGDLLRVYNSMNIFVDGSYSLSQNQKNNRKINIFGYSGNDSISLNIKDNAYIEAGLGSDTITTGSGNDTIYTNADIDDRFDNEDKNTTNTVNSGAGDDTIYGSKGKDIITTKKGTNHIYTKSGDDEVNVEDGKNYIYLGSGSDKVNTNNGTNYIYTEINNTNENDQDTKDDINTVVITTGQNYIYGGKGVENLHILEGVNNANLGNGKNTVDIKMEQIL